MADHHGAGDHGARAHEDAGLKSGQLPVGARLSKIAAKCHVLLDGAVGPYNRSRSNDHALRVGQMKAARNDCVRAYLCAGEQIPCPRGQ